MRIVGWPEQPDAEGSIDPITIVDVDFYGTPEELRAIGNFLLKAAAELEYAQSNNAALNTGIELENSNPSAGVGRLSMSCKITVTEGLKTNRFSVALAAINKRSRRLGYHEICGVCWMGGQLSAVSGPRLF